MSRLIARFYLLLSNALVFVARRSMAAACYFTGKAKQIVVGTR